MTCPLCTVGSSPSSSCRTCRYVGIGAMLLLATLAACSSPGTVVLDTAAERDLDPPTVEDTATTPPLASGSFADTNVEDWMPVTSGNWENAVTGDACNDPNGPTCYDCLHVPSGTYARWFRQETEGGGYSDDDWFEATLGQLVFEDFDAETGEGLTADGGYYAFDTLSACAAVYWQYDR